ncbi:MAG: DUF1684 domain-containing protein [Bacteroidia bacterium]|nr:DUF1684 domain-containing protein [Bacteroidia bacterium]
MSAVSRKSITTGLLLAGTLGVIAVIFSQLAGNPSGYEARIEALREQKNLQFRNDPDSPIPRAARGSFEGLSYFPVQELYAVTAVFEPDPAPDTLRLMTTQGKDYPVIRAGKLRFVLQGIPCTLTAYQYTTPGKNDFFVPFRDLTTGVSTYGGGRYLDVPQADPLVVDFNSAYNPYCVYNADYVCPLPPSENKLSLEIAAGEKGM